MQPDPHVLRGEIVSPESNAGATKPSPRESDGRALSSARTRQKLLVRGVLEFPLLRYLIDSGKGSPRYRHMLNRCMPASIKNRGVYESFEDASAAVPKGIRVGFDHNEIANVYKWFEDCLLSGDYPAMFWMRDLLERETRIFDLGGSVGITFYSWKRYISYPKNLEWVVCELPAVSREGTRLATERQEDRLRFTSDFRDAEGFEVVLMSGCLQYIETPAWKLLHQLKHLPRHLIINRIPLHDSLQCVTLQNVRWMVSPYRIFNRQRFIAELESCGYKLVDSWQDAEHSCWIPFYPEYSVDSYSGLYFRREEKD